MWTGSRIQSGNTNDGQMKIIKTHTGFAVKKIIKSDVEARVMILSENPLLPSGKLQINI